MSVPASDLLSAFLPIWATSCTYSIWRGGAPERVVALLFLIAFPLSRQAAELDIRVTGVNVGSMTVDVAMLIVLVIVARRADRYWPLAMAGFQILQVAGSILKLADPVRMPALLYWLSKSFWAYPMLLLLIIGTRRHIRRVRLIGHPEPSWSNFSPEPFRTGGSRQRD